MMVILLLLLAQMFTLDNRGMVVPVVLSSSDTLFFALNPAKESIVTDSVVWQVLEVLQIGNNGSNCDHEWVEGDFTTANPGIGCLVIHQGFHCSYDDKIKSRICRKCLRKETLREQWYQHAEPVPKSEYDRLNDSLNLLKSKFEQGTG